EDVAVVRNLKSNNIPVVVVLLSGRPMILNQIQHYADAIIAAWLPGTEGQGVADVLFGDYLPTGKLPHSWPREMAQIPINFGDAGYSPLYEYGFGLTSYTNPSAGSAPQVLSALASAEGNKVEITFSKQMTDPSADYARFKVTSNSIVGPFVTKAELSSKDKTTIILTLEYPLQKGDKIAVSYTEGNIVSADGGKLKSFSGLSAYNLMNEYSAFTLPGKIEAENYSSMSGVQTETTTDAGGGLNVGYIDTGDWMEYYVNIPSTGKYNFNFRVAAQTASGQLLVKMSDTTVATVTLPVTGGWQTWRTQSATANLTKGMKYLRLHAATGGFNINWFEVTSITKVEDNITQPGAFSLSQNYPNPFNPVTTIIYSIPERSNVKLAVYDLLGRELAVLVNEGQSMGSYSVTFDAASYGLSSGIYFYKLTAGDNTVTKKLTLMK
ncbi:MAG: carbohydrate-binding protein, partial [Syntrophothermus sp.]